MNQIVLTVATSDAEIVQHAADGWAEAIEQGASGDGVMGYIRYLQHQRDLIQKGQGDA